MISPAQIRAARALIGWSQQDLVLAARLTPASLSRLESGLVKGRANTLQRLENAFVNAGVEFLGGDGVRLRQKSVGVVQYDGPNAIQAMQDDMYATMVSADDRMMYLNGVDERQFFKTDAKHLDKQRKRFLESGVRQKILIQEGDRFFIMPPEVATYRWISPEMFGLIPSIIYGRKVATIFWGPPSQVIVMESAALAETHRKQFNALWKMAKDVPFSAAEIRAICKTNQF